MCVEDIDFCNLGWGVESYELWVFVCVCARVGVRLLLRTWILPFLFCLFCLLHTVSRAQRSSFFLGRGEEGEGGTTLLPGTLDVWVDVFTVEKRKQRVLLHSHTNQTNTHFLLLVCILNSFLGEGRGRLQEL